MAAGDNRRPAADWSDLTPADQRLIWRHLSYLRRRRRYRPATARSLAKSFIAARSNPPTRRLVDWSHLPPDVLPLISRHLTNIWDYLRFRAVCSAWRSAAGRLPRTPSLILPYDPASPTRSFLDPSDRRIHTMDIPEARAKWIYGTPHGWLVMLGKEEGASGWMFNVSLLNPITGHQILLPPLPHKMAWLPERQLGIEGRIINTIKLVLTANPTSSSSPDRFLGLLIFSELALCELGGAAWKLFDLRIRSVPSRLMVDLAYFDGRFYVVDIWKGITSLSTKSLKKQYSAPPSRKRISNTNRLHLVEMAGDLLLLERREVEQVTEVFKLDGSGKRLKWTRVEESIGDVTLFASCNLSAVSVPSDDLMEGGGDRICFAGCGYEVDRYHSTKPLSLCISDIVAGSSIGRQVDYWQGSRRACEYGDTLNGLSWIIPSLS